MKSTYLAAAALTSSCALLYIFLKLRRRSTNQTCSTKKTVKKTATVSSREDDTSNNRQTEVESSVNKTSQCNGNILLNYESKENVSVNTQNSEISTQSENSKNSTKLENSDHFDKTSSSDADESPCQESSFDSKFVDKPLNLSADKEDLSIAEKNDDQLEDKCEIKNFSSVGKVDVAIIDSNLLISNDKALCSPSIEELIDSSCNVNTSDCSEGNVDHVKSGEELKECESKPDITVLSHTITDKEAIVIDNIHDAFVRDSLTGENSTCVVDENSKDSVCEQILEKIEDVDCNVASVNKVITTDIQDQVGKQSESLIVEASLIQTDNKEDNSLYNNMDISETKNEEVIASDCINTKPDDAVIESPSIPMETTIISTNLSQINDTEKLNDCPSIEDSNLSYKTENPNSSEIMNNDKTKNVESPVNESSNGTSDLEKESISQSDSLSQISQVSLPYLNI